MKRGFYERVRDGVLYATCASSFFLSSCATFDDLGKKFYGENYWKLMWEDFNLATDTRASTEQARKIKEGIEKRILQIEKDP